MNCPSGQGMPCPHKNDECAYGCRFQTEDLCNSLIQRNSDGSDSGFHVVMSPGPREWMEDMFYSLVDLCRWVLPVGFVLGLGYGMWRLAS